MTYYEILGVERDATFKEIKQAFRRLSMRIHPDRGGTTEEFQEAKMAYECLSNANRREAYDRTGNDSGEVVDTASKARAALAELFSQVITNPPQNMDIVDAAKKFLHGKVKELDKELDKSVRDEAKFMKMAGKAVKKGKGVNILKAVIEERVKVVARHRASIEENTILAKMCLEMVEDYEYAPETTPGQRRPTDDLLGMLFEASGL